MRIDGSDITQLSDDRVNTLNVDHEWVFYSFLDENGLTRMNHDGSDRQVFGADEDDLYKTGRINNVWNQVYSIKEGNTVYLTHLPKKATLCIKLSSF